MGFFKHVVTCSTYITLKLYRVLSRPGLVCAPPHQLRFKCALVPKKKQKILFGSTDLQNDKYILIKQLQKNKNTRETISLSLFH